MRPMEIETRQGEQLARYLNLATSEIKLTAANMANIDTPGYRAVGLDFETEMRESLKDLDEGDRNPRPVRVRAVDGLISRPDGNRCLSLSRYRALLLPLEEKRQSPDRIRGLVHSLQAG